MPIGFSIRLQQEQPELRIYGRRGTEPLPLVQFARLGPMNAVIMGRLHYRDELSARLGPRSAAPSDKCHAALSLAAYERWGAEGLGRLEGEFALAVFDGKRNRLYLRRDPMGGYPLYWTQRDNAIAIATQMGFLQPRQDCDLDYGMIADYFALPSLAANESPSQATVYRGIHRIQPGEIWEIDLALGEPRLRSSWKWLDHIRDPGSDCPKELSRALRRTLAAAVRERAEGVTAAHFSGGMDSTSVALLARDAVCGRGHSPLHAISLVYKHLATLKGEAAFIETAIASQPSIALHPVAADDLLAYDPVHSDVVPDEPFAGLSDRAKDAAMLSTAAQLGVQTVLTGQGGDDVCEISPYYMADRLKTGHAFSAWREATIWGHARNVDPWYVFWRYALSPHVPPRLQGGLSALLRRGRVGPNSQGPGTIPPWIRPEFARQHAIRERALAHLEQFRPGKSPAALAMAAASARLLSGDALRWTLAVPRNITVSHPFTDPRVISLGLGFRLRYQPPPDAQKPLLAAAMRDLLPDAIRMRRSKANFNETYYKGLARNLPRLTSTIRKVCDQEGGVFDGEALITFMKRVAAGGDYVAAASKWLDATLALVLWFDMRGLDSGEAEPPVRIEQLRETHEDSLVLKEAS